MIEGPKAGGHLGFSREQLEEYAEYDDKEYAEKSYDDEVKKIMAVVRKYGEKIRLFNSGRTGRRHL